MSVYLVSTDQEPFVDVPTLGEIIEQAFAEQFALNPTTHLVSTEARPEDVSRIVIAQVPEHIRQRVRVYVLSVCHPVDGWGPQDARNWLDTHLVPDE